MAQDILCEKNYVSDLKAVEPRDDSRYPPGVLRSAQCRAARALLGWSQKDLAERAGVRVLALRRFESGATDPRASTRDRIEKALLDAGIELIEDDGVGVKRHQK
jgi:DNA-binding XRE family transcriptional regulator